MLARDDVYLSVAPTLWDIDFRTAVSQAELEDRERPAPITGSPLRATTAPAPSRSTPPGPSCSPAASRWSPTRTTRATDRSLARRSSPRSSASKCPFSPTNWPTPKRARDRHDLHLRRHDRRHVVARIESPDAERSSVATAASCRPTSPAESCPVADAELGQRALRRSRGRKRQPGARGHRRRAARKPG